MYRIYVNEVIGVERELGVTEARKRLAQMIDEVQYQGENYIILRHGEPAAAVVPMEIYLQWKQERQELFDLIRSVQAENESAKPDEVMADVLAAQQAVREGRRG